jgi:hypothetical protein
MRSIKNPVTSERNYTLGSSTKFPHYFLDLIVLCKVGFVILALQDTGYSQ